MEDKVKITVIKYILFILEHKFFTVTLILIKYRMKKLVLTLPLCTLQQHSKTLFENKLIFQPAREGISLGAGKNCIAEQCSPDK